MLAARALATRRGSNHAPTASKAPIAMCKASLISGSGCVNSEAVAAENRVAYEGRRDIAELQAYYQRPWKSNALPAKIDAALYDPSRTVAAE